MNLSGPGQRESFRFYHQLGSLGGLGLGGALINLPGVCRRRDVPGRLRSEDGGGGDALRPLHDLPIAQVSALVADDHPAVEVQHHRGRSAQHPPGRFFDGEAPSLPTDEIAVKDRPDRLEGRRPP